MTPLSPPCENVEKNQFLVVNQFTVKGSKQLRRPDIVVFINGLPIAVIELKNPASTNADIWSAYHTNRSDFFLFPAVFC